jgi:hypothetical protein
MQLKLMTATFGILLLSGTAYAGPLPGGPDTDGDTVENAFDNCTSISNSSQTDANKAAHDGCGDACTVNMLCDIAPPSAPNNDINVTDFNLLKMNLGATGTPGTVIGDCSPIDGTVNVSDFNRLKMNLGNKLPAGAGPSGVTTAQCDPGTCQCTPQ